MITFSLSYEGNDADDHEIDFYDVAQGLIGFQRSLAITTHLVLNGTVITQAPALKNARIVAVPPEEGSWKIWAAIIAGAYGISTAPQETPLGHLVYSAYDYVISEATGEHVNYEESLGQMYERLSADEQNKLPIIEQSQLDSVIEKCEYAIQEIHRPIIKSETATKAVISVTHREGEETPTRQPLNRGTYEYIRFTTQENDSSIVTGRVSSYNINTFKGRMFVDEERRPIPFTLADCARSPRDIAKITQSLTTNAQDRYTGEGDVQCVTFKNISRTGRLKSLYIVEVN